MFDKYNWRLWSHSLLYCHFNIAKGESRRERKCFKDYFVVPFRSQVNRILWVGLLKQIGLCFFRNYFTLIVDVLVLGIFWFASSESGSYNLYILNTHTHTHTLSKTYMNILTHSTSKVKFRIINLIIQTDVCMSTHPPKKNRHINIRFSCRIKLKILINNYVHNSLARYLPNHREVYQYLKNNNGGKVI